MTNHRMILKITIYLFINPHLKNRIISWTKIIKTPKRLLVIQLFRTNKKFTIKKQIVNAYYEKILIEPSSFNVSRGRKFIFGKRQKYIDE